MTTGKKDDKKDKFEKNFETHKIKSNGNCGYNSILYSIIKNETLKDKLLKNLKKKICSYI